MFLINKEIPTSCGMCKASGTGVCKVWMRSKDLSKRHNECPIIEMLTCEKCFYWKPRGDGYDFGWCKRLDIMTVDKFYCGNAEKRVLSACN